MSYEHKSYVIVLNSNRCLNSTFGFGVLFVWSIIYTYTCISISSKEAWKQVGKKYALIQPYCKTTWIYSPRIDFTSSPKKNKLRRSLRNNLLTTVDFWTWMLAIPSCRNTSFDASQTYNFTATLIKHSWGQACPCCSIIPIFNAIGWKFLFLCFRMIFLGKANCPLSLSLSMLVPIFFLFSS